LTASLPSGITFTRSSVANYYNSSGVLASAAINAPRLEYNPSTLLPNGLVYENAGTNVQNYSVIQTNGNQWQCNDCSIAVNAIAAPDGTTSAASVTDDTTANAAHEPFDETTNITPGTTVAVSGYVKQGTGTNNQYMFFVPSSPGRADGYYVIVGMAALTCSDQFTAGDGTFISCSVQVINNGWLRICVVGIPSASQTPIHSSFLTSSNAESDQYTGDATLNFYLWGVDKELASACSSYIQSFGSPVTRSADVATFTVPSGIGHLTYGFNANTSFQTVTASPGSYTIPYTLNLPDISSIVGSP
jgi:hypothetical protein